MITKSKILSCWIKIRWYPQIITIIIIPILILTGCNTYLGYHIEEVRGESKKELIKTSPLKDIKIDITKHPLKDYPFIDIEVTGIVEQELLIKTEIERVKKKKYNEYDLGGKLLYDVFLNLVQYWILAGFFVSIGESIREKDPHYLCFFPPFDLIAKLFGLKGIHGNYSSVEWPRYDHYPPSYIIRLSHNFFTAPLNIFQTLSGNQISYKDDFSLPPKIEEKTEQIEGQIPLSKQHIIVKSLSDSLERIEIYTNPGGEVKADLSSLIQSLTPHKQMDIIISATSEGLSAEKKVSLNTDDLLTSEAIAKWEEEQLEKKRTEARKSLAEVVSEYKDALEKAYSFETNVLLTNEFSDLENKQKVLTDSIESNSPPSADEIKKNIANISNSLKQLSEKAPIIKTEKFTEAQQKKEQAKKAFELISKTKAPIYSPAEMDKANASIKQIENLLSKGLESKAVDILESIRLSESALSLIQQADQKTQTALAAIVTPTPSPAKENVVQFSANLENRKQIALVIGINDYNNFPKLQNGVNDAKDIADVLKSKYGFMKVESILNEQATRAGILEGVRNLVQSIQEGEDILIFYSGHGYYDEIMNQGYWIPIDAQNRSDYLPNSEIIDSIKAMDRKGAEHIMVIADSCFSGTLLEDMRTTRDLSIRPKSGKEDETIDWLKRVISKPSRIALTSGASDEPVPDTGGRGGHSIFTDCLLEVLRDPGYSTFTGTELGIKVRRLVGANSEQSPQLGIIQYTGHKGGEFVFFEK